MRIYFFSIIWIIVGILNTISQNTISLLVTLWLAVILIIVLEIELLK